MLKERKFCLARMHVGPEAQLMYITPGVDCFLTSPFLSRTKLFSVIVMKCIITLTSKHKILLLNFICVIMPVKFLKSKN